MESSNREPPENLVTLLRSGRAPREVRVFAAREGLPLDPDDSLRALLAVVRDPDAEIVDAARSVLHEASPDRLTRFIKEAGAAPDELDVLARETEDSFVLEEIVRAREVRDETLLFVARGATGRPQEALIANQARLLAHPELVEALFQNPDLSPDGRRLLSELTEEFFEKEARRRGALRAREAALEGEAEAATDAAGPDPDLDDDLFIDSAEGEAESDAPPAETEPESEEDSLFIGAIYRRIGLMTVHEKINLAYKGSKEERRVLIGDPNKLIGLAVLKSRAISVNEVETFAGMRNLDEEVFRRIVQNREWMRKPAIVLALIRNPRVPVDITLPLLKRLPVRDLRVIVRDRNLATVLRQTARRFLVMKRR